MPAIAINFHRGTTGRRQHDGRGRSRLAKAPVATVVYNDILRARIILGFLLAVFGGFVVRAFYLQVIRYDYYSKAALNYQLKEYQISAERGVILAKNGSRTVPLVLNEIKYTLFADPVYVKDPDVAAKELVDVIGGDQNDIATKLKQTETRYVILAKKLSREQHEKITDLELKGIGTREEVYRTYPQGTLAANTLGFVNDDGDGQYGIEQFLDKDLSGKEGQLKAITDAKGVPLVSNPDNIIEEPVPGRAVTLSIDIGMQKQVEDILKAGLDRSNSQQGSLLVMNPNNGQIVAMASYPSYDPADI
ncbi:hypothetical protein KC867_02830, partial [Candidatus Saccharibacteria bacterium]|nr:hypothetical protein [Candidatus Saccharibacteria bacterium]